MSTPLVSIIIVNYNGRTYLYGCFSSLENQSLERNKYEIIMVDNGSSDGSCDFAQNYFQNIKIIESKINNYCRSCNIGINTSRGEYVAFVNNDMTFDKFWLETLLTSLKSHRKAAGVQSKILTPQGDIYSLGGKHKGNYYYYDIKEGISNIHRSGILEAESLCGASALYHKEILEKLGLFDEDFIMYYEDVELSYRIRSLGYKLITSLKSIAVHHKKSFGNKMLSDYLTNRNRFGIVAKHFPEEFCNAIQNTYLLHYGHIDLLYELIAFGIYKLYKHYHDFKGSRLNHAIKNYLSSLYNNKKIQYLFDKAEEIYYLRNTGNLSNSPHLSGPSYIDKVFSLDLDNQMYSKERIILDFYTDIKKAIYKKPTNYYIVLENSLPVSRNIKLVFDIHPAVNPSHPDRHYSYFAWHVKLAPNEKIFLKIKYNWEKEISCESDKGKIMLNDYWRGPLLSFEKYEMCVYLVSVNNEIIDKYYFEQDLKT